MAEIQNPDDQTARITTTHTGRQPDINSQTFFLRHGRAEHDTTKVRRLPRVKNNHITLPKNSASPLLLCKKHTQTTMDNNNTQWHDTAQETPPYDTPLIIIPRNRSNALIHHNGTPYTIGTLNRHNMDSFSNDYSHFIAIPALRTDEDTETTYTEHIKTTAETSVIDPVSNYTTRKDRKHIAALAADLCDAALDIEQIGAETMQPDSTNIDILIKALIDINRITCELTLYIEDVCNISIPSPKTLLKNTSK